MSSIVKDLQKDILSSKTSVSQILRTAKVISAELGLQDIADFIERELSGYHEHDSLPPYRIIRGGTLSIYNPVRGWQMAGDVNHSFRMPQPIAELEDLARHETVDFPPPNHIPVTGLAGSDHLVNQFPQKISISGSQIRSALEAIKNEILNWTLELKKKNILGESMAFNDTEKTTASSQVFNIQQFTGVIGDVKNSSVQICNYSSIHQTLRQLGVPQAERNEIENIMNELSKAEGPRKQTLVEKAKAWVVKNEQFLGASIGLIKKALGLDPS